jgi:hypothetical protein
VEEETSGRRVKLLKLQQAVVVGVQRRTAKTILHRIKLRSWRGERFEDNGYESLLPNFRVKELMPGFTHAFYFHILISVCLYLLSTPLETAYSA